MNIDFGEYGVSVNDAAMLHEYGLASLTLTKRGDLVTVNMIVAEEKGKGRGTRFMTDLAAAADSNGWTLALTPDYSFGATSVARLKRFYKRFGFKENKGRYTDFTISESMVRRPQTYTR
jgi:predicted GNAT family N-acyltransferase